MTNLKMTTDGDILKIEIDLSKRHGPSKSGKTEIIASTNGNISAPDNPDIKIGINCYCKKQG